MHTPGPWIVEHGSYDEQTNDYPPVVTHEARNVCTVESYYGDDEDNARLIAAAPDLLEALIECEVLLDQFPLIKRRVKAAIAKAEGRD